MDGGLPNHFHCHAETGLGWSLKVGRDNLTLSFFKLDHCNLAPVSKTSEFMIVFVGNNALAVTGDLCVGTRRPKTGAA